MKKIKLIVGGAAVGVINALFGAGGGMIAVPLLAKNGLSQKEAQATAVSVILPLAIISGGVYLFRDELSLMTAVPYIIPGMFGAVLGALILKRLPDRILKKIFALFMIWAGIRMVMK